MTTWHTPTQAAPLLGLYPSSYTAHRVQRVVADAITAELNPTDAPF